MVQERFGTSITKGAGFQNTKKEKESMASSVSHQQNVNKSSGGKYGAWGPVFKNKQNFIDMHCG